MFFLKTKTAPPGVDGGASTRGSFQDPSGASRLPALCETENPKSHMDGASSSGGLWGGRWGGFWVVFPGTNQPGNQEINQEIKKWDGIFLKLYKDLNTIYKDA